MNDPEQNFGEVPRSEPGEINFKDNLAFSITAAEETLGVELNLSDIRLKDKEPVAHSLTGILNQLLKEYATTRAQTERDFAIPEDHWPKEQAFFRNEALRRINAARQFFNQSIPEEKLLELAHMIGANDHFMEWLSPGSLVECNFVPAAAHEIIAESLRINPQAIVPDIRSAFTTTVRDSTVTFVGSDPDPIVVRNIASLIQGLENTEDIVVAVPFLPSNQPAIDRFLATGKFDKADELDYDNLYEQFNGLDDFSLLDGTVSDAFREAIRLFPLFKVAREKGIKIVACNVYGQEVESTEGEEDLRRYKRTQIYRRFAEAGIEERYWDEDPNLDQGMFYMINNQVRDGKKVIAVTSREDGHALFKDREIDTGYPKFLGGNMRRTKQYRPSVARLAKREYGDRVKSFVFENNLSLQEYASPGERVSSILFEAMKKFDRGEEAIGFRVDDGAIANIPDASAIIGADFYVPVYR